MNKQSFGIILVSGVIAFAAASFAMEGVDDYHVSVRAGESVIVEHSALIDLAINPTGTVSVISVPIKKDRDTRGTLEIMRGAIKYIAPTNYFGVDEFEYRIKDDAGSILGKVIVKISEASDEAQ